MKVTFFTANSGRTYFEKFLKSLSLNDRAIILAIFADIKTYGLNAKGCEFRQIEGKLWEIKMKTRFGGYRFFYILIVKDHMHVLHFYKKESQKAPMKELSTAIKRLKDFVNEK